MSEINNSIAAVAAFYRGYYGDSILGPRDYSKKELNELGRIEGIADPQCNSENLASMLKAIWVARQSGELADDDLDNCLWALFEFAHLVSQCVWVAGQAEYLKTEAEAGRVRQEGQEAA